MIDSPPAKVDRVDVAYLTRLGFDVFPCWGLDSPKMKQPRTQGRDWRAGPPPGGWEWAETDLIGVNLPVGAVVLDIDDQPVFRATGRDVTPSAYSATHREGGLHIYYRSDRPTEQVTEGHTLGYDTRVGGKGYVIAWNPEDWVPFEEWGPPPDWLYEPRPSAPAEPPTLRPLGTRQDILSFLGRLAVQGGLGYDDYESILLTRLANGTIVNLDPSRPWTVRDLRKLAREASEWPAAEQGQLILTPPKAASPGEVLLPGLGIRQMDAAELLGTRMEPLQWRVDKFVPEGLGVIAAPPKTGKSVLAYQIAVELALGGSFLGVPVTPGPVLYYALEDGQRRSQTRVAAMLHDRDPRELTNLLLRWDSPKLGGPLEQECHEWLGGHPGGLIIIDVLAKVRPHGGGKSKNAYDEDYDTLATLHSVAKMHPGSSILVVTHDRKAGSDDFMTRVTGTRGVTGVADFVMFIDRSRAKSYGKLLVTGRDVEDHSQEMDFDVTGWRLPDPLNIMRDSKSAVRQAIVDYLMEHGCAKTPEIVSGTGRTEGSIAPEIARMREDGLLRHNGAGYVLTASDESVDGDA